MELVYPGERVTFYSEGVPISGLLWVPDERQPGESLPGIVVCRGMGANKEFITPGFARELNRSGYVALGFDYRGVGESGGETGRLIPQEHVEDVRAALTYLESRREVDPGRLGLFGDSVGGGYAVYVAGVDQRVKCTISLGGPGDGYRWFKMSYGYERFRNLLRKLEEDRKQRVLTGKSGYVPVMELIPWGEEERHEMEAIIREFGQAPRSLGGPVTLETGEKWLEFAPESVVHRIAPRAVMFTTPEVSVMVPPEESVFLYEKAAEPKKLWIQSTDVTATRYSSHHGQEGYTPEITRVYIEWFDMYLKP